MMTIKVLWYYGINYIDNDEIIECEWFKTKQERNKKIQLK
jgi:hypothetical protein